jgi:hypothetical protein
MPPADPAKQAPTIPPVVAGQVRGFLPHPAGGDARKAASQPGDRRRGREVHQGVGVVRFAVELGQFGPEVPARVPQDLLCALQDRGLR